MRAIIISSMFAAASAQRVGHEQAEDHPKLSWKNCTISGGCETVNGEVVLDANWRWLHVVDGWKGCFEGNTWNYANCNSNSNCTDTCAIEGAGPYPRLYGVNATQDSLSLKYKTYFDFSSNIGSRVYLMASETKYQMFVLMNNELAFDVDLSAVECGFNSALYFVAMDEDGGMSRYPTNHAGAKYGTGYCDARCLRDQKFVGGKVCQIFVIDSRVVIVPDPTPLFILSGG
jgi:cellulose 1,4-beta-cellobiosidase